MNSESVSPLVHAGDDGTAGFQKMPFGDFPRSTNFGACIFRPRHFLKLHVKRNFNSFRKN